MHFLIFFLSKNLSLIFFLVNFQIFLTMVMLVSVLMLGYFFVYILRQGGQTAAEAGRDELELKSKLV
jgi:hypothetical protein